MIELDLESDAFLELLTDALRAGPGSPQWHQAIGKLRAGGMAHSDEYQLLIKAREHLEGGKEYRSVRAGPEFSRKLMSAIDEESNKAAAKQPMTSTAVALGSAGVMLLVLMVVGYLLWYAADRGPGNRDGTTTILSDTITTLGGTNQLPSDWQTAGALAIDLGRNSIKPTTVPSTASGGALLWQRALDPSEPFAISATLKVQEFNEDLIPQIFVTDQPQLSQENSTTAHELVWLLRGNQVQVISPGGRMQGQSDLPVNSRQNINVHLTVDHNEVRVDLNGQRFWSGSADLDPAKPRHIGIRYLRSAAGAKEGVTFQSLRVHMSMGQK